MKLTHDGNRKKGSRKAARPLDVKKALHLTLACTRRIYGERKFVEQTLEKMARKFGLALHDYAVAIDHVHFVTKVPSRAAYRKFVRAFCSLMTKKFGKNLFRSIYTSIVTTSRYMYNLFVYCKKNREEAFYSNYYGKPFRYHRPPKPEFLNA